MMKNYFYTFLACLSVFFFSCEEKKKDEVLPEASIEIKIFKNLDARDLKNEGRYTFFSFKNNDTIAHADSATTKWDIGFSSTTIIVNGGTSGPGNASGLVYVGIFDELAEAPAEGYNVDNVSGTAIPTGTGAGWYNYSGPPNHIITPIPGRVLVFRTADGNYVKVDIISYYKDAPANPAAQDPNSRWYTFRYAYQANGSRALM